MSPNDVFTRFLKPLIAASSTSSAYGQMAQVYASYLAIIKPISVLLSIGFIVGTIYFIVATNWYITRKNRVRYAMLKSNYPKRRTVKIWREIEHHAAQGDEKDWRIAIIEADKVLDEILKTSGFPGTDMGERLKSINPGQLTIINEVWETHKLRNRLVHEIDIKLTRDLTERALGIYAQAFRELGLLD